MPLSPDIFKRLPFFTEPAFRDDLMEHGALVKFNKGDVIVRDGQYVKFLPIVLNGAIRVFQQKEDREILLYYVRAEETCTMSLAAAYFNNQSSSHGCATESTELLIFPASLIDQWQLNYPSWNRYVLRMFRLRYDELISSFEHVAFDPVNVRVLRYLQQRVQQENTRSLDLSHQHLAGELGTTRVVISRILKDYEHAGKVKLFRGRIEML